MNRLDFLRRILLAPIVAFLGLKLGPRPWFKVRQHFVAPYGGEWRVDFARDVWIDQNGREYTLEYLEANGWESPFPFPQPRGDGKGLVYYTTKGEDR